MCGACGGQSARLEVLFSPVVGIPFFQDPLRPARKESHGNMVSQKGPAVTRDAGAWQAGAMGVRGASALRTYMRCEHGSCLRNFRKRSPSPNDHLLRLRVGWATGLFGEYGHCYEARPDGNAARSMGERHVRAAPTHSWQPISISNRPPQGS